jgi:surfactin synthase thioesterase subunit
MDPLEMNAVDATKTAGYVISPALDGDDAVIFVPGLGGRTRFVDDWNAPGREPVIRRATWNQPLHLPPIDERGAALASLVTDAGAEGVVLVGHSMGGLVCLEAAARLGPRVRGVVVVCQHPPHRTPISPLIHLSDPDLAGHLGVPPHVLDNPAVLGEYARLWRAEYQLLNGYLEAEPRPVIEAPIVAVGAADDPSSNNVEFLRDWRRYTTGRLSVHLHDGGHQVIEDLPPETVHTWISEVRAAG